MKRVIYCSLAIFALLSFSACDLFKIDNYDEPAETLTGEVVDVATGEPVLTDQGSEGIRVRLMELSWGENVTPYDFYCMPNGTFRNTKLFKANYNIRVDGPFIPLVREDTDGRVIKDDSKTMDIEGTTSVKFEVQPFLKVEWVGEPAVVNGRVRAQVKVTRAVSEADFRAKIEPMGAYSDAFLNMTDIQLFVSLSSTVGYRARDTRWSSEIKYTGQAFNGLFGQTVTIESNAANPIPSGYTVFVRAAARINYATPAGTGTMRYNYNEAKEVIIP